MLDKMISKEQSDLEDEYEKNIENNLLKGILHPKVIRLFNQNPNKIPSEINKAKDRYQICKACDKFNNIIKTCSICNCFMPLKTQFDRSKCPENKW